MSVFELLTEEDKEKIIRYIDCYGPIAENSSVPRLEDVETVLHEWDIQKSKDLEKLFGGQLILNRPYTYTVANDGVIQEVEEAMNDSDIYYNFKNRVRYIALSRDMADFEGEALNMITELFWAETLASNAYGGDNLKITFPDGEIWKISKGMKPMKIFHKLISKYGNQDDLDMYEEFRNWHSQLLNQIHLDGTLSLSIHPLDYMTMSDNGGSWNSCMRWQGDDDSCDPGDYRMGTVECMNSPFIIVAYLHNPKKQMEFWEDWREHKTYTWNKKKWRELFIVREGIITEIKGYPFQDENLTNTVLMWLKELASNNLGWEYDDVEVDVSHDTYRPDGKANMFRMQTGSYMYNDFGTLSIHRGRVNLYDLRKNVRTKGDSDFDKYTSIRLTEYFPKGSLIEQALFEIPYGGRATCMCCGDYVDYYDSRNNEVLCRNCESSQVCPCCGEYFDGDGYNVAAYNEPICYGCYEYECNTDDLTDDREYHSSLLDIYLLLGYDEDNEPIFYDNYISTLDPDCYTNFEYEKIFTAIPKIYKKYVDHGGWGSTLERAYVTFDMVKDWEWFEDVYDLDHSDLSKIFEKGWTGTPAEVMELAQTVNV